MPGCVEISLKLQRFWTIYAVNNFEVGREKLDSLVFAYKCGFMTRISSLNAGKGVTGAPASVLPRRWAAVFVNTSVAVGRDWVGGWADCNGTCSNSNYPWTHAAVEDLLGPRVAFIITRHKRVWSVPLSWHESSPHQITTPFIQIPRHSYKHITANETSIYLCTCLPICY